MVVPNNSAYDPSVHLSLSDIAVDNPERPAVLRLTIKQSKTDPFQKKVDLFLGKTDTEICPVRALLNYMILHGTARGPLFILEDSSFLTRHYFVSAVRGALQKAGVDQAKYCGQFSDWGSHNCSSQRDGGLNY